MKRRGARRLSRQDRLELARGILRRWEGADTPATVAARLGRPVAHVMQAVDEPIRQVREAWRRGTTADDIAAELGFPVGFVKYSQRRTKAQSGPSRGTKARHVERQVRRGHWLDRAVARDRVWGVTVIPASRPDPPLSDEYLNSLLEVTEEVTPGA